MPGLADGKLKPCPSSPNCVCSQGDPADTVHFIDPILFTGEPGEARRRLVAAVTDMKGVVVNEEADYLHFNFTTAVMRFVDDVEFLIDPATKTIHVRSASRVGYGDFGVNRKRVERLRKALV